MVGATNTNFKPIKDLIEKQRLDSGENGRLGRALGKRNIISDPYRALVRSNPERLLRMPYLTSEIHAFKKVISALQKRPNDPDCAQLAHKLRLEGTFTTPSSILCPVARHLRSAEVQLAMADYFHESVKDQWVLVTIIHGPSTTLEGQEKVITEARVADQKIRNVMLKKEAGLIEIGAFEPDLRHIDEFIDKKGLKRLSEELGWTIEECGAYVCSSHKLVRVSRLGAYRSAVRKEFPGYRRVRVEALHKNKTLIENVEDILGYIWKYDSHVRALDQVNFSDCKRNVRTVFLGPVPDGMEAEGFDSEEAIRRFALYHDRMGFDFFEINYINKYALAWHSEKEEQMFREHHLWDKLHGHYNWEPRRTLFEETSNYKRAGRIMKWVMRRRRKRSECFRTTRTKGHLMKQGGSTQPVNDLVMYSTPIV